MSAINNTVNITSIINDDCGKEKGDQRETDRHDAPRTHEPLPGYHRLLSADSTCVQVINLSCNIHCCNLPVNHHGLSVGCSVGWSVIIS